MRHFVLEFQPRYQSWGVLGVSGLVLVGILIMEKVMSPEISLSEMISSPLVISVLLFLVFFSLVLVKSISFLNHKNSLEFFSSATVEISLLLGLILLGVLITVGLKQEYFFTIHTQSQLNAYNFDSIAAYAKQGVYELLVYAIVVYVSIELAGLVLDNTDSYKAVLRVLGFVLVWSLIFPLVSVGLRLFWYIQTYGLTQNRVYGLLLLLIGALFIFSLSGRLIMNTYNRWQMLEMQLIVVVMIIAGMLNADYIIASYYLQTSQTSADDYLKLVELSPDSVGGWVDSYFYIKNNSLKMELESNKAEISEEQIEVSYQILSLLRRKYFDLAQLYGTTHSVDVLNPDEVLTKTNLDEPIFVQLAATNLAEWNAYRVLSDQIPPEELVQLEELYGQKIN